MQKKKKKLCVVESCVKETNKNELGSNSRQ